MNRRNEYPDLRRHEQVRDEARLEPRHSFREGSAPGFSSPGTGRGVYGRHLYGPGFAQPQHEYRRDGDADRGQGGWRNEQDWDAPDGADGRGDGPRSMRGPGPGADADWYAGYGGGGRSPAARGSATDDYSLAGREAEQRGYDYGEGDDYRPWMPRGTQPRAGDGPRERDRPDRDFSGRGPKGYVRSDERLKEDICERLTDDPRVDASDIGIEVRGGTVTLTGQVGQRWIRHHVEDLVDRCNGVQDIENRIAVRPRDADAVHERGQSSSTVAAFVESRGSTTTRQ